METLADNVMGLDLSLRGSAAVALPYDFMSWGPDAALKDRWFLVRTIVRGYELEKGATDSVRVDRMEHIARGILEFAKANRVRSVFIEGYAYAAKYQAHQLGELGGIVRFLLKRNGFETNSVPVKTARKYWLGKLPRKGEKELVWFMLQELNAPFKTKDEADAFVVANWGLSELGQCAMTLEES